MLSRSKKSLAAVLLVVAAACIAMLLNQGPSEHRALDAEVPFTKQAPSARGAPKLPGAPIGGRIVEAVAPESSPKEPVEATPEPGILRGVLFDSMGMPLADKLVSLSVEIDFPRWSWRGTTDKQGEFLIRGISPGHHYVKYGGTKGLRRTPSLTLVPSEIDIASGDNGFIAFTLTGNRVFRGQLIDPAPEANGGSFEVYLRPVGVPEVLLARITTITNHELDNRAPVVFNPNDPGDRYYDPAREAINGGFWVEGLPAMPIEVTIYADGEHRFFIKEEIDLTDGAVNWGRRKYPFRDFLVWMRQRNLEEKPIGWRQTADETSQRAHDLFD